ncbi:DUF6452 family protein [Bacteroides bouchesdurhonensis]|uniref:DUF6452 family protein n=1 Tax=Bacteroides bouchesdurhonensis TaxID=1841855 RepID=UPI00097F915D|nr:DUF6452 family protein [Bacteroides bouchesdurhonensis]
MKNLIRIFLLLIIAGGAISIYSSCSDENDCSLAGRPMMYCTLYTIDPDTRAMLNDTLDSLTITAAGTDSIILNNEKKVHTLMLPLRYTNDSTIYIFHYDPKRQPKNVDTLYIVQQNTPYFQSMECGYMMKQNILSAKLGKPGRPSQPDRIDSLYLRNKEANTNEIENLQIFYKYRDRTPAID